VERDASTVSMLAVECGASQALRRGSCPQSLQQAKSHPPFSHVLSVVIAFSYLIEMELKFGESWKG